MTKSKALLNKADNQNKVQKTSNSRLSKVKAAMVWVVLKVEMPSQRGVSWVTFWKLATMLQFLHGVAVSSTDEEPSEQNCFQVGSGKMGEVSMGLVYLRA